MSTKTTTNSTVVTAEVDSESTLWVDRVVDMPGMGPGASKAGWWVKYLAELASIGRYDDMLKYLGIARRTGAIDIIIKAKEELNKKFVKEKIVRRQTSEIVIQKTTTTPQFRPGARKCASVKNISRCNGASIEMKEEPYFYVDIKKERRAS
jgi:hypothetical protein